MSSSSTSNHCITAGLLKFDEAFRGPCLEYVLPANSPMRVALLSEFNGGLRHLLCEEKLRWLGLHSLLRRRLRADLITAFKISMGLLGMDQNLFILPPSRQAPPPPSAYNPGAVTLSSRDPTPCCVFVVSSGPFWPTFYYFKS